MPSALFRGATFATSMSVARPRLGALARLSSPWWTSTRFSPTKGTTSATVPSAARPTAWSKKSRIRGAARFEPLACWQMAQASFNATPEPLRSPNG